MSGKLIDVTINVVIDGQATDDPAKALGDAIAALLEGELWRDKKVTVMEAKSHALKWLEVRMELIDFRVYYE